jgi:hypothetical protein
MKTEKEFDCVEMKNAIQRRLQRRRRGMPTDVFVADMDKSIAESRAPIATWWNEREKMPTAVSDKRPVASGLPDAVELIGPP